MSSTDADLIVRTAANSHTTPPAVGTGRTHAGTETIGSQSSVYTERTIRCRAAGGRAAVGVSRRNVGGASVGPNHVIIVAT